MLLEYQYSILAKVVVIYCRKEIQIKCVTSNLKQKLCNVKENKINNTKFCTKFSNPLTCIENFGLKFNSSDV